MSNHKFFICKHCGNLVGLIVEKGGTLVCCGEKMAELVPNKVEAAHEKHIPVYTLTEDKIKVTVGSVEHPMTEEHYIGFIFVQTETCGHRKTLKAGDAPAAEFCLNGEKPLALFAYCNLHGLWQGQLK